MTPWSRFLARELAKRGWTEAELARRSGVPKAHFTKWKSLRSDGTPQLRPTVEQVRKLANTLGITVLRAMVLAELITAEEARQLPRPDPDVTLLSNEELVAEMLRRLNREEPEEPVEPDHHNSDRFRVLSPSAVFSEADDTPA